MKTSTYLFRATVYIKVEGDMRGTARKDAEAICDEIRASLPAGASLPGRLS